MKCKRCGHEKTWQGDDPKCPFQTGEIFGGNWNCGIINEIRNICEIAEEGIDYRLQYQYCEDQKYVTIKTDCIENDDEDLGLCLFVSWYKNRGATDAMWLLDHNSIPRKPTYQQLAIIIEYYEKTKIK
jgi:hypothetical protein